MTILENPKRSKMHPGGHLQPIGVENQNYGLSIYLSVKINKKELLIRLAESLQIEEIAKAYKNK